MTADQMISGAFGSAPITADDAGNIIEANAYAFQAFTETVIKNFYEADETEFTHVWTNKTIPAGVTVYFGMVVPKFKVTSGTGQYFKAG